MIGLQGLLRPGKPLKNRVGNNEVIVAAGKGLAVSCDKMEVGIPRQARPGELQQRRLQVQGDYGGRSIRLAQKLG